MSRNVATPPLRPDRPQAALARSGQWLANLPVGQKLLMSTLLLGLPLAAFAGNSAFGLVRETQLEGQRLHVTAAYDSLQKLQLGLRSIRGDTTAYRPVPPAKIQAVLSAAQGLEAEAKASNLPALLEPAQEIITEVRAVAQHLSRGGDGLEIDPRILALTTGPLAEAFTDFAEAGRLTRSSSDDAAALTSLATDAFPVMLPRFGRFLSLNAPLVAEINGQPGKEVTPAQRELFRSNLAQAQTALNDLKEEMEHLSHKSPVLGRELEQVYAKAVADSEKVLTRYQQELLDKPRLTIDPSWVGGQVPTYLPAQYEAFSQTVNRLNTATRAHLDQTQRQLTLLLIGLALLTALLVFTLRALISSITGPLRRLTNASEQLGRGQFDVQVPVQGRDELGALSSSFNVAAAQLRASAERDAQERLEAQKLQHNIGAFLDVTMDIADGDLTKRGQVTEDVLGNVVDSINLMTDELAGTLKQVQHASESVTGGSRQMLGTTHAIQQGAQLTAEQAQRVAEQVEQITRAIRTMAQSAQTSAETARQALLASQQGQQAVQETLGGMQNIRTEVQGVSRRVRSLGERSLEIQEIVDTISQIARRTNLLALNASVEAAGAGEAGGRFGAVADEIRQLATTSAQATTRIAALIKSVQLEVQDVIIGAEEGTREVEQGYRIAGSAGERLREIGQLTEHSAQLAESIAASTQQQVQGVEQVSQAVQQIASVAQQAEGAVEQGRSAAEQLEDLAQQLSAALRRFRLPA